MGWEDDVDLDDLFADDDPPAHDLDIDLAELRAAPMAAPALADVIACRACGCQDLRLRSTEPETGRTQFACRSCAKITTLCLPHGYRQVYVRIPPPR